MAAGVVALEIRHGAMPPADELALDLEHTRAVDCDIGEHDQKEKQEESPRERARASNEIHDKPFRLYEQIAHIKNNRVC